MCFDIDAGDSLEDIAGRHLATTQLTPQPEFFKSSLGGLVKLAGAPCRAGSEGLPPSAKYKLRILHNPLTFLGQLHSPILCGYPGFHPSTWGALLNLNKVNI